MKRTFWTAYWLVILSLVGFVIALRGCGQVAVKPVECDSICELMEKLDYWQETGEWLE